MSTLYVYVMYGDPLGQYCHIVWQKKNTFFCYCHMFMWIINTIEYTPLKFMLKIVRTRKRRRRWRWKYTHELQYCYNSTAKRAHTDKWIVCALCSAMCKHKNLNKRKICTEFVIWLIVSSLHFSVIYTQMCINR